MISIGLTGWTDHDLLTIRKKQKLEDYASHFPVVEMDTSFYAIPSDKNILSWIEKTPESFQFIPKAFQSMTTHKDWKKDFPSEDRMFQAYLAAFEPMIAQGRVKTFLFQFPPFFDCTKENVLYLRKIRHWMADLPAAVEFRNPTWYNEKHREGTLDFLSAHQFIHTVTDQPQTPNNSIPLVAKSTNKKLTIVRLHGRNYEGWLDASGPDWREKRTLYNYSESELKEFSLLIKELEKESEEVTAIFNNNSGGHAAANAKQLQQLLDITFKNLAPTQLDLFSDLF